MITEDAHDTWRYKMADIDYDGPLFNGRALKIFEDAAKDIEKTIATDTLRSLKRRFHVHFKHPTGRYESNVHVSSAGRGTEVTDRGIVYGPWLEGTGKKNRTTRFRGYHSFEDTAQEMEGRAEGIADRRFRSKWLRRLD